MARLDAALTTRGLARSRSHAARLIADGLVTVDGITIVKSAAAVADDAVLAVAGADHYVSRAAHKLIAALDGFGIDPRGRVALDMGASTGGFTQVLRERGAEPVLAVDVGHDQLAAEIAADAGVRSVEGFNVRHMTAENLAGATGVTVPPQVVTGDLSFISLEHVIPAAAAVAASDADVVLLVKPQFEVGRTAVKGGLVTSPGLRAEAISSVLWSAWDAGLGTLGILPSPILGTHGNAEFLIHLRREGANPTDFRDRVLEVTGA
ncbi:TlyA family RNA methyltransferase [Microbacterium sp. ZW T5_56]|uniref:TlyA family RNA methyltransferase n=1 Tax=Microbacterium sp. ZW T5_56 TaxID=3378081 RepID=UPI003853C1B8